MGKVVLGRSNSPSVRRIAPMPERLPEAISNPEPLPSLPPPPPPSPEVIRMVEYIERPIEVIKEIVKEVEKLVYVDRPVEVIIEKPVIQEKIVKVYDVTRILELEGKMIKSERRSSRLRLAVIILSLTIAALLVR